MKSITRLAFVFLLCSFNLPALITLGGLTEYPTQTIGPNLLVNPSFEEAIEGEDPTGWSSNGFVANNTVARSGTGSYRITNANTIPHAQSASQSLQLRKGIYRFSGWVKLENMAATTGSGVRICFNVGAAWPYTVSACTDIIKGTADWQQLSRTKIVVPADSPAKLALSCYGEPDGTAWFDDVELRREEMPLEVFMLYPNYRGMLFSDQSQITRFDLSVDPPSGTTFSDYQVKGSVTDETTGLVALQGTFPASASGPAQFDFLLLPQDRTYLVEFELLKTNGSSIYKYPAYRIVKADGALRQSMTLSFDEHNRFLVRGKPTFLLGVYDSGLGYTTVEKSWEDTLTTQRKLFELPINLYLNYWYGAIPNNSALPLMNVLQQHGMMFLQTSNCFSSATIEEMGGESGFWWETAPMADLQVRAAHPGFAGVYVADECRNELASNVFAHRGRTLEADPNGITLGVLFADAGLPLWRDSLDVIATDPYPVYGAEPAGGFPLVNVAAWTRRTRQAVKDSRPFATVLQYFQTTSNSRWPTQAELRNMSYMAITEGANGLLYWSLGARALAWVCDGSIPEKSPSGSTSWCPYRVELFNRLKAVLDELEGIEPALAGEDRPDLLAGNTNSSIRTRVKLVGDTLYLFAYNETNSPATATFTVNGALTTVTLYNETDVVSVSEDTFTGDFDPYEAHVYIATVGIEPPPPPPPICDACERIDAMQVVLDGLAVEVAAQGSTFGQQYTDLQAQLNELATSLKRIDSAVNALQNFVADLNLRLSDVEDRIQRLRQALQ